MEVGSCDRLTQLQAAVVALQDKFLSSIGHLQHFPHAEDQDGTQAAHFKESFATDIVKCSVEIDQVAAHLPATGSGVVGGSADQKGHLRALEVEGAATKQALRAAAAEAEQQLGRIREALHKIMGQHRLLQLPQSASGGEADVRDALRKDGEGKGNLNKVGELDDPADSDASTTSTASARARRGRKTKRRSDDDPAPAESDAKSGETNANKEAQGRNPKRAKR